MKKSILLALPCLLAACHSQTHYEPGFTKPNQMVTETVAAKIIEPKVKTSFSYEQDLAIKKAYDEFSKTGAMPTLESEGFLTFPYDGRSHVVIACEPLHLCVMQLEEGENINDIDIGDAANWLVSTSLLGTTEKGTYQVTIKPKRYDVATDLVITTTRRTYNIGLVSQHQANTHVVNFYYPLDSLQEATRQTQQLQSTNEKKVIETFQPHQLNFQYSVKGNAPWRPIRIFDDGAKTFIELPLMTESTELPVFYIKAKAGNELINYRYKKPYLIVDGLFNTGILISGKGGYQLKVTLTNQQWRG